MSVDLQKDAEKIREYILERVKTFQPKQNDGPGKKGKPIQAVYVGYETSQAGWMALIFDTRPDASHDGEWTCHLETPGNMLELPHWSNAEEHAASKGGYVRAIGETIQAVLLELQAKGEFDSLPLQDDYWLGIEDFDGGWAWTSDDALSEA